MAKSVKDISTFSILLLISMTIFTLLGLELYAYKIQFLDHELTRPKSLGDSKSKGYSPRLNFDTAVNSFITIFTVIVGDDWNAIMYSHYRVLVASKLYGEAYFTLGFFIFLFIVGNFVLLNLFLAILLANFDLESDKPEIEDE
jgi:hypothetical protein